MIFTVFPNNEDLPPRDFPTLKQAEEYAAEFYPDGDYVIESTEGECV